MIQAQGAYPRLVPFYTYLEEKTCQGKRTSLFVRAVSYEEKKFDGNDVSFQPQNRSSLTRTTSTVKNQTGRCGEGDN